MAQDSSSSVIPHAGLVAVRDAWSSAHSLRCSPTVSSRCGYCSSESSDADQAIGVPNAAGRREILARERKNNESKLFGEQGADGACSRDGEM